MNFEVPWNSDASVASSFGIWILLSTATLCIALKNQTCIKVTTYKYVQNNVPFYCTYLWQSLIVPMTRSRMYQNQRIRYTLSTGRGKIAIYFSFKPVVCVLPGEVLLRGKGRQQCATVLKNCYLKVRYFGNTIIFLCSALSERKLVNMPVHNLKNVFDGFEVVYLRLQ